MLKRMLLWSGISLVLLLALLAAAITYLLQHPQWLLKHANDALAPYQIHIRQLDWEIPDRRTLQLPELALDYADNQLSFHDIQLTLKQALTLSQLWDWYQLDDSHAQQQAIVNAIEALSYRSADIAVPVEQLLPSTSTEPLWLPIAGTIPHIDFGVTNIRLKDATEPLGLQLRHLTFDASGQLSSELASLTSDTPLWQLAGRLPLRGSEDWQLHTQVQLAQLYQIQQQLVDSPTAAPLLQAYPWLAPDWPLAGAKAFGELRGEINLSRKTGALAADVCWQDPALEFPAAAATRIQLQGSAIDNEQCPSKAIALHYLQQPDANTVSLAPLNLSVSLSQAQRAAWQQWLPKASQNTIPALEKQLTQLHQQLSLPHQPLPANNDIGLQLDLPQGLQLSRNANNDWHASLPALTVKPSLFDWLNVSDAAVFTVALNQTQATLPAADLQQLSLNSRYQLTLTLPQGLKFDHGNWSASGSALSMQLPGEVMWNAKDNKAEFTLAADAALSADKLMAQFGAQHFSVAHLQTSQQGAARASWQHGVWQFNLPATSHQWRQIKANLPPHQLSLQQLDASLPAFSSLTLDSQQSLLPQLQQQTLKGQMTLALELPHISTTKKSRFGSSDESLLNLRRVSLAQQLDWHDSQLQSQEIWQVDDVTLHSDHRFTPQMHGYQLHANWQTQASLLALQQIAAKNLQLEDKWQITGQSQFNAQVDLSQRGRELELAVDMQPQIIGAAGQYQQLPFADMNLNARCHYRLFVSADTLDSSNIGCQQFALTASSFNPGIQLSQIDIRGRGKFEPVAPNTKVDSWLLPGIKDAKLQLQASAAALNGLITIPDFDVDLQGQSHGVLLVQGMDIEQLLAQHPQDSISATGIFDGVLPMTMENRQVSISGGHLAARNEGLIEIHNTPAIAQMRQSQPYLDYVLDFMQHLQYQEILGKLDMNGQGDTKIELKIKGHGQGVDRPVHLNYSHEENLLQLLQSLTIGERLQSGLEASMQ